MKTAEFGQPVKAALPGRCRFCGTAERAGQWADETKTLCREADCIAAARAELTVRPDDFRVTDADLIKAGVTPVDLNEAARVALRRLSAKIEAGKAEAFSAGLDFAHGPVENEPEDMFAVRDIWSPRKMTVTVKAGAVPRSFEPPPGWSVYRNPDYDGPKESTDG